MIKNSYGSYRFRTYTLWQGYYFGIAIKCMENKEYPFTNTVRSAYAQQQKNYETRNMGQYHPKKLVKFTLHIFFSPILKGSIFTLF